MEAKQERSAAPARVAIYARVSSEPQVERGTIQSQIDDLLARAAADGHSVGAELRFIDNGYSGASLVRPALERLRDLAAMAVVDRLYVHAPDRLARNYAYQAVLVEEFAHTGTEVVFLNRPIGQSAEDNLLLQLQGMFAEYERTKMLERSRRGKRHLARAGVLSVMSGAPFGYRYVGREAGDGVPRFDVAENQAEVVRAIFQWVGREHITLSAVCRRLLEAGVSSPTGLARWGRSTVWNLLSNPTYIGQAAFGSEGSSPGSRPCARPMDAATSPNIPAARLKFLSSTAYRFPCHRSSMLTCSKRFRSNLLKVESGSGSIAAVQSICFRGCSSAASAGMLSVVPTSGSTSRNASSTITTTDAQGRMLGGSMGSAGAIPA